jgi:hypothetical protein
MFVLNTFKNFWQYSSSTIDGRPYNLDTARARLTVDGRVKAFTAHADFDNQLAAGSYFRTKDFKAFGYAPPKPWLDMEHTVSTGTTNGYGIGAYRAWIGLESDQGTVRAGRQRIAWGTGKIWNPTDVLNPFSPTAIERTERRGVDALYARVGVGAVGQAELVWAGEDRFVDHQILVRGRQNFFSWDTSLMGGKIAGSTAAFMVGGDFAGTLFDGTLHGEWGYFNPQWRTPYWKAGIGWDYSVPSQTPLRFLRDAAFVFEYFHAGNGQTETKRYDFNPLRSGKEVSVARHYFGASASQDLTPLIKLELLSLINATDGSTFFSPSLTWNALTDLYLSAALQRFSGEGRTEYGRNPNQTVLTAQYYF